MKVCELIKQLEQMDGSKEVYFAYPANDFWKSTVASEVCFTQNSEIVWSDYHDGYEKPREDFEPEENDKIIDVVLLV